MRLIGIARVWSGLLSVVEAAVVNEEEEEERKKRETVLI